MTTLITVARTAKSFLKGIMLSIGSLLLSLSTNLLTVLTPYLGRKVRNGNVTRR